MRLADELFELRAERFSLVRRLNISDSERRQRINRRLTFVNDRIQRLCEPTLAAAGVRHHFKPALVAA